AAPAELSAAPAELSAAPAELSAAPAPGKPAPARSAGRPTGSGSNPAAGKPTVTLATVLVGDDPASQVYVRGKHRDAQEVGMGSRDIQLPAEATQQQVEELVASLAEDPGTHGILVQLPLPAGLDPEAILRLIPLAKDVDGLTPTSLGSLVRGLPGHVGATPRGVMALLARYGVPTAGKRAVVVGRSTLVGLPLVILLGRKGTDATVTLAHSRTPDLAALTREADIVVAAAGVPGLITAAHVKPGAAVIDVGTTRTPDGIRGDVAFDEVAAVAGAITPMPGGTGPMTRACLLENVVDAARMQGACPLRKIG
ncbi:MAG: bifunctional 5,10-methylenetetrahydrofolate dehydrogenase/5,10-methenyltetrahydrofolate cyclohydrolase, partial [Candidatus Dormibacteria bacterium]